MNRTKTLVLGASQHSFRFSFKAANSLIEKGIPVLLVGKSGGEIKGNRILQEVPDLSEVDTLTMYLNPKNQKQYYESILYSGLRRIIFNPGSENVDLMQEASNRGIQVKSACTLVMLSTGVY